MTLNGSTRPSLIGLWPKPYKIERDLGSVSDAGLEFGLVA